MQTIKAFENYAYSMKPGELSMPVRTTLGYHIIKLHSRKPNPGMRRVAHILIPFQKDSVTRSDSETLALAEEVYQKIQGGADFGQLAEENSSDADVYKRQLFEPQKASGSERIIECGT